MKRQNYTITDVTGDEGRSRLDHYNKWLMDPKRSSGTTYPGYTGTSDTVTKVTVDETTKRVYNKRIVTHTFKGNEMKAQSKLFQATAIVNACADKAEALAMIMKELNVTKSNAFVYYTKVQKAKGVEKETGVKTDVKPAKTAKTPVKNTSKVTEITSEKALKKVGEIDKVIASLKANGATASPFAGLVTGM